MYIISKHPLFILGLLGSQLPPIEIPHPDAQVRREAQPPKVRGHAPGRDGVELAVQVGQVDVGAEQRQDVDRRGDGLLDAEKNGRPDQVQGKLDRVDGRGVACGCDGVWTIERGEPVEPGAMSSVAHQAIKKGPRWAEEPCWRGKRRLAEAFVGFLGFLVFWGRESAHLPWTLAG